MTQVATEEAVVATAEQAAEKLAAEADAARATAEAKTTEALEKADTHGFFRDDAGRFAKPPEKEPETKVDADKDADKTAEGAKATEAAETTTFTAKEVETARKLGFDLGQLKDAPASVRPAIEKLLANVDRTVGTAYREKGETLRLLEDAKRQLEERAKAATAQADAEPEPGKDELDLTPDDLDDPETAAKKLNAARKADRAEIDRLKAQVAAKEQAEADQKMADYAAQVEDFFAKVDDATKAVVGTGESLSLAADSPELEVRKEIIDAANTYLKRHPAAGVERAYVLAASIVLGREVVAGGKPKAAPSFVKATKMARASGAAGMEQPLTPEQKTMKALEDKSREHPGFFQD